MAHGEPAVRLRGGTGGVRLVVEPGVAAEDLAGAVKEALSRTAQLGPTEIAVELPQRALTPDLAEAVCRAVVASGPGMSVRSLSTAPLRERRALANAAPPSSQGAVLHRANLRAGQEITSGGDVVVLGHVHSGARVTAGGDVVVLGRLEGTAHAGALGDDRRIVYATRFMPVQVRIADLIAVNPGEAGAAGPEWAHVDQGQIVVQAWRAPSMPHVARSAGPPAAVS